MIQKNLKNIFLFLFIFCATFTNAQKQTNKVISLVKVNETYWTNELNKKNRVVGTQISLTTGFNKPADIRIYLNKKLIKKCSYCQTNESVGFVMEKNVQEIYFKVFLNFKKVKKGDEIIIEYDSEIAVYKITSKLFKYPELNISRQNNLNWFFSFVNEGSIKYIE